MIHPCLLALASSVASWEVSTLAAGNSAPFAMIYLDNAASARPAPTVLAAMARAAEEHFANPSSVHKAGAAAARALEQARADVAALLGAEPTEIIFTSGGTESDALGVLGAARAARGRHIVVSAIEHPAVLRSAQSPSFDVTRVAPGQDGVVTAGAIAAALRPDTAVVAVMLVNNELGTLQPIAAISAMLAGRRIHFHVDAVQAAGLVPVSVRSLGADSVAISGHKMRGPRGVGALWRRAGARLAALWDGGRQEAGLRSGTENLPGAVALGEAARLARDILARERAEAPARPTPPIGLAPGLPELAALRDRFEDLIFAALPGARPTVPRTTPRAPHISSVLLPHLPAEPLLHALEHRGVIVAAGSACASRTRGPSHVLAAIGVSERDAVLRISLGRDTRADDIETAARALPEAVAEVRDGLAMTRGARRSGR
jgi:cysteine desulfurase